VNSKHRLLVAAALTAVAALVFVAIASGDHGRGRHEGHGAKLFASSVAPSVPADPKFHNVAAGGAPWRLDRGSVRINHRGDVALRVEGLVLTTTGDAGPVKTISASLFCGEDADTAAAATTNQVPLSSDGDARIRDRVTLPANCLAPIVLVHPNGGTARYIAVSGWKS
jgi:hypothetical protein